MGPGRSILKGEQCVSLYFGSNEVLQNPRSLSRALGLWRVNVRIYQTQGLFIEAYGLEGQLRELSNSYVGPTSRLHSAGRNPEGLLVFAEKAIFLS